MTRNRKSTKCPDCGSEKTKRSFRCPACRMKQANFELQMEHRKRMIADGKPVSSLLPMARIGRQYVNVAMARSGRGGIYHLVVPGDKVSICGVAADDKILPGFSCVLCKKCESRLFPVEVADESD